MPFLSQRFDLINSIKAQALLELGNEDLKTNHSHVYVAIKEGGRVVVGNISIVTGSTVLYAMAFAKVGYSDRGFRKTSYRKYLVINSKNEVSDNIHLDKWSLDIIFNVFDPYGYNSPNAIISLNEDHAQKIEYSVECLNGFKEIWDFFVQVNANCTSSESATIYKEFYKEQIKNNKTQREYNYLLDKIRKQEDLIKQYAGLIDKIKEAVNGDH
jgi:hypothetical protein